MSLLKVENLKMYYKTLRGYVKAVDDVTFDVGKKDAVGLAGESGCGKTSTALTILRLLPWNAEIISGSMMLDGMDLAKISDRKLRKEVRW